MVHWREFVHKNHLIPAFWAALIALIGFLGGLVYHSLHGPEAVTVENGIHPTDTLVVRVATPAPLDTALANQVSHLNREISRLLSSRQVERHIDIPNPENLPNANKLVDTLFRLPSTARGYLVSSLAPIARAGCPDSIVDDGGLVTIGFTLFSSVKVDDFSPAILTVIRTTAGGRTQVFEQQYKLRQGRNLLVFAAAFGPGDYEVGFGVYRRAELQGVYPPWFSRRCPLSVRQAA